MPDCAVHQHTQTFLLGAAEAMLQGGCCHTLSCSSFHVTRVMSESGSLLNWFSGVVVPSCTCTAGAQRHISMSHSTHACMHLVTQSVSKSIHESLGSRGVWEDSCGQSRSLIVLPQAHASRTTSPTCSCSPGFDKSELIRVVLPRPLSPTTSTCRPRQHTARRSYVKKLFTQQLGCILSLHCGGVLWSNLPHRCCHI
jgi:hypothetical protein